MKTSESTVKISEALNKFQSQIKQPKKDTQAYNYKYAPLDVVIEAVKGDLGKNGLSIVQFPVREETTIGICTRLQHTSGEFYETSFTTPVKDFDPQKIGSTLTYYRRYSYMACLGIAPEGEDDDAQSASESYQKKTNQDPKIITFGKYSGQNVDDLPVAEALNYFLFLKNKAEQDKKEFSGASKRFYEYLLKKSGAQ